MLSIKLSSTTEICALLSGRVRQVRLAQNLTQAGLAQRAGISSGAVRKLESGGLSTLATFVSCLRALGAEDDLQPVLASRVAVMADIQRAAQATQRKRARPVRPR